MYAANPPKTAAKSQSDQAIEGGLEAMAAARVVDPSASLRP